MTQPVPGSRNGTHRADDGTGQFVGPPPPPDTTPSTLAAMPDSWHATTADAERAAKEAETAESEDGPTGPTGLNAKHVWLNAGSAFTMATTTAGAAAGTAGALTAAGAVLAGGAGWAYANRDKVTAAYRQGQIRRQAEQRRKAESKKTSQARKAAVKAASPGLQRTAVKRAVNGKKSADNARRVLAGKSAARSLAQQKRAARRNARLNKAAPGATAAGRSSSTPPGVRGPKPVGPPAALRTAAASGSRAGGSTRPRSTLNGGRSKGLGLSGLGGGKRATGSAGGKGKGLGLGKPLSNLWGGPKKSGRGRGRGGLLGGTLAGANFDQPHATKRIGLEPKDKDKPSWLKKWKERQHQKGEESAIRRDLPKHLAKERRKVLREHWLKAIKARFIRDPEERADYMRQIAAERDERLDRIQQEADTATGTDLLTKPMTEDLGFMATFKPITFMQGEHSIMANDPFHFAALADDFKSAVISGGGEIENAKQGRAAAQSASAGTQEFLEALGFVLQKIEEETPFDASIKEQLIEILSSAQSLPQLLADGAQAIDIVHADEFERMESTDPNADKFDVSKNREE